MSYLATAQAVPLLELYRGPTIDSERPDPRDRQAVAAAVEAGNQLNAALRISYIETMQREWGSDWAAVDRALSTDSPIYYCDLWGMLRPEEHIGAGISPLAPLVLWQSQVELTYWILGAIDRGGTYLVPKTRKIGVTHLIVMIALWLAQLRGASCLLTGKRDYSVDTTKADTSSRTLFGKARQIMAHSPRHLRDPTLDVSRRIIFPRSAGSLIGEPTTADTGRDSRFLLGLSDDAMAVPTGKVEQQIVSMAGACTAHFFIYNSNPRLPHHALKRKRKEMDPEFVRAEMWTADPYRRKGETGTEFLASKTIPIGPLSEAEVRAEYCADDDATVAGDLVFPGLLEAMPIYEELPENLRLAAAVVVGLDFGGGGGVISLNAEVAILIERRGPGDWRLWIEDAWHTGDDLVTACATYRARWGARGWAGQLTVKGDPTGEARESDKKSPAARARSAGVPVTCLPGHVNHEDYRAALIRRIREAAFDGRIYRRKLPYLEEMIHNWRRKVISEEARDLARRIGAEVVAAPEKDSLWANLGEALTYAAEEAFRQLGVTR